jgi:hypothetical protein
MIAGAFMIAHLFLFLPVISMPVLPTWFVTPLLKAFSGSLLPTDKGQASYWFLKSSQSNLNSLLLVLFFTASLQTPFWTTRHCPNHLFVYPNEGFPADRNVPSPLPVKSHPCVKSLMKCLLFKDQTFPSYLSACLNSLNTQYVPWWQFIITTWCVGI